VGASRAAFARRYRAALLDFLLGGGETALLRGQELGRRALKDGFGPVTVAEVHHRVLVALLEAERTIGDCTRNVKRAELFLLECLAPFEVACRGYLELVGSRGLAVPSEG
jgi:Phosphoserine phosphatase RsbU, N-terminal domain